MSLLKIAFQAFFQPEELEKYLRQKPKATRNRLLWGHIVLMLTYGVLFSVCYSLIPDTSFGIFLLGLIVLMIFSLCQASVSMGISFRISTQDDVDRWTLPNIIGTYWSIVVICLLGVLSLVGVYLLAPFAAISIGAFFSAGYRKTTGVKAALIFVTTSVIVVMLIFTIALNDRWKENSFDLLWANYSLVFDNKTQQKHLSIEVEVPTPSFKDGVFFFADERKASHLLVALDSEASDSFQEIASKNIDDRQYRLLKHLFYIDSIGKETLGRQKRRILFSDDVLEIHASRDGFTVSPIEHQWNKSIVGDWFYQPHLLNNRYFLLRTNKSVSILDFITGSEQMLFLPEDSRFYVNSLVFALNDQKVLIEERSRVYLLNYENKVELWNHVKRTNDWVRNGLVIENSNIFLQNEITLQIFDPTDGREIWSTVQRSDNPTINSFLLPDGNILLVNRSSFQVIDYRNGERIWNKPLPEKEWGEILGALLLNDGKLFLQTSKGAQVLNSYQSEDIVWETEVNWYKDRYEDMVSPVFYENIIYGISITGELLGLRVSDGNIVHKISPPLLYNTFLQREMFRNMPLFIAYYIPFITIFLCLGIYRIPIYFLSVIVQLVAMIDIGLLQKKNISRVIQELPLFFDHISTLPLPYSKRLLWLITDRDKSLGSGQLIYLY